MIITICALNKNGYYRAGWTKKMGPFVVQGTKFQKSEFFKTHVA